MSLDAHLARRPSGQPVAQRNQFIRRLPGRFVHKMRRLYYTPLRQSRFANLYHCTTQKAGSQWIKRVFADPLVWRFSALRTWDYEDRSFIGGIDPRPINQRLDLPAFPDRIIATPLYIDYPGYKAIPKNGPVRALFVLRDPRDLVVSDYFSSRYSHAPMGDIPVLRQHLNTLDEPSGMLVILEILHSYGTFECQRSWMENAADPEVLVVRFEDMISDAGSATWERIFDHLDIRIPRFLLSKVLRKYSFSSLAGRSRGVEDKTAHFRKGVHGDWKNHFSDGLQAKFKELTGNLVQSLGYE